LQLVQRRPLRLVFRVEQRRLLVFPVEQRRLLVFPVEQRQLLVLALG
jgi:hypothetical protein